MKRRPDREVVLRLLAANGQAVTLRSTEFVEDAVGRPVGVEVTESGGVLFVTPELLGWSRAELGLDPEDDDR